MKYKKNLKIKISEKKIKDFKSSPVLVRQFNYIPKKLKNIKHTVIIENISILRLGCSQLLE